MEIGKILEGLYGGTGVESFQKQPVMEAEPAL